jgi:hypothetical protein
MNSRSDMRERCAGSEARWLSKDVAFQVAGASPASRVGSALVERTKGRMDGKRNHLTTQNRGPTLFSKAWMAVFRVNTVVYLQFVLLTLPSSFSA